MMNKVYKINKYVYTFIFSIISVFVFLIDLNIFENVDVFLIDNSFVNFFTEFYFSLKEFDIIYVTLWIFILYFYFNVYFDGKKYDKKCRICTIIAIIFAILTLIGKSYYIDNSLSLLIKTNVQIFKSIILLLGYYLIYYAIFKKIFNLKLDMKILKKKIHLS